MLGRHLVRASVVAVLCAITLGLAGCTGSSPHYAQPTLSRHATQPSTPSSSAPRRPQLSAFARRCLNRRGVRSGAKPVIFFGGETQREFCGIVWSSDRQSGCTKLAYGAKVIAFLRKHKCGPVRRVLATVYAPKFSVNFSSVIVKFAQAGTPKNPNGTLFDFTQLAKPRGTAGMRDLLQAGNKVPGPHSKPAHAYLGNDMLNSSVDLFYDWYGTRPKSTHFENSLRLLGQDFAFTQLTG